MPTSGARSPACRSSCLGEGGVVPCFLEPLVPPHRPPWPSVLSRQEPIIFHEDGKQILAPAGSRLLDPPSGSWPFLQSQRGEFDVHGGGSQAGRLEDMTEEADADTMKQTQLPRPSPGSRHAAPLVRTSSGWRIWSQSPRVEPADPQDPRNHTHSFGSCRPGLRRAGGAQLPPARAPSLPEWTGLWTPYAHTSQAWRKQPPSTSLAVQGPD